MTIADELIELRAAAEEDAQKALQNGVNPFTTHGGRHLWQQGWDDVRPANLTDGSIDWRFWERGRLARAISHETETEAETETETAVEQPRG